MNYGKIIRYILIFTIIFINYKSYIDYRKKYNIEDMKDFHKRLCYRYYKSNDYNKYTEYYCKERYEHDYLNYVLDKSIYVFNSLVKNILIFIVYVVISLI